MYEEDMEKDLERRYGKLGEFTVAVKHDGRFWKVYYYPITNLENDLANFGKFLDFIIEKGEKVHTIVPNTGFVSWVLGTGFQGVKGFAVFIRKELASIS